MEKKSTKGGRGISIFKVQELGILMIFLILCLGIQLLTPKFLKPANLINIMRQISNVGIMAVGEAMVIIIAGIDLSVGATLSLSACVAAYLAQVINPWLAVLVALLTGLSIGMINGFLSVNIGIAPFKATLGTQMMARGLAFMVTAGIPIKFSNAASVLGGGRIALPWKLQLPVPILFMLAIYVIGIVVMTQTVFGRNIYAVGDNEKSAKLSGINSDRIKITAYVVSGFLAAVAGILYAGNLTTAEASAGDGIETNVIAAVVIGGVSMAGGEGSVVGILIGAAIMGVIKNAFILLNFPATMQTFTIGLMIVLAVGLDCVNKKRREKKIVLNKAQIKDQKNEQAKDGK